MDIIMCRNEECPRKEKCFRYTATVSEHWQAVFGQPFDSKDCEYFIDNTKMVDGRKIGKWWK